MIKLGVIADDFTGAGDAASFLVKAGNKTILLTDIPDEDHFDCDCIVVALKVRSVDPQEAIREVKKVMDFFDKIQVKKVYFKYCSTFDSTPKGNIGVIMDYLMERMNVDCSILCPSLPVNGRTVKNGVLYVNGVPLSESPMKDHPLNPMWDSYIPALMKEQSAYPCYPVLRNELQNVAEKKHGERCYYIPDYETDRDGQMISEVFKDLRLYSGGSGLLEFLMKGNAKLDVQNIEEDDRKAIIVCGSCSRMTNAQVQSYKNDGNQFIAVHSKDLLDGKTDSERIFEEVMHNLPSPTLVYSDGCEGKLNKDSSSFLEESKAIERVLSEVVEKAKTNGFNKFIVAGGETSGSAVIRLGYKSFYVGRSVAPGVPVLTPTEDPSKRVILKSGNFGDENFFMKALEAR